MPDVLGEAVIKVGADTSDLRKQTAAGTQKAFSQTERDAKAAGTKAGSAYSGGYAGAIKRHAAVFGFGLGVAGVVGFAKASINAEKTFSQSMNQMAAVAGVPQAQIKELSALALKMGKDTVFSAGDAANAMLELAKGGLTAADIKAGGLKGTLTLAAAGGLDLANAATFASNAMNTFGLTADKIPSIAAALAGGANASTASVQSLGEALSQVGPGARNAGLSLQDTVGVLAAFDQAGIKGSDAGTSLKTMLTRLIPTTKSAAIAMDHYKLSFVNADGSFKSITEIAETLRKGLGKLSAAQKSQALTTIFGTDATRAASVLLNNGAKGIEKYIKATKDQTAAQKVAASRMKGTAGAIENLKGSYETLQIQLGQALAPTVVKTANTLNTKLIPALSKFVKGAQDGTGAGGEFVDTAKEIVHVGKQVVGVGVAIFKTFDSLPGPVKKFSLEIGIAALVIGKMNNALAASKFGLLITDMQTAETRAARTTRGLQALGTGLRNVAGAGGMLLLADSTDKSSKSLGILEGAAGGALSGAALGAFAGAPGAAIGAGIGAVAGGFLSLATNTKKAGDAAGPTAAEYAALKDTLDGVTGATTAATVAFVNNRLTTTKAGEKALATAKAAGISQRELVAAEVKGGTARLHVIRILNQQTVAIRKQAEAQRAVLETNFRTQAAQSSNLDLSVEQRAAYGRDAAATKKQLDALNGVTDAREKAIKATLKELGVVDGAVASKQRDIAATKIYKGLVKAGIPKVIATEIQAKGILPTTQGVATLLAKYGDLSRKQINTIIKQSGADTTVAAVQKVIDKIREANKTRFGTLKLNVDTSGVDSLNGKLALTLNYLTRINKPVAPSLDRTGGGADGGKVTRMAGGGLVPGRRMPYGDKVLIAAAPGERVITNRRGEADQFAPVLKAINSGATQAQVAAMLGSSSQRAASVIGGDLVVNYPAAPSGLTESLPTVMANLEFLLGAS